MSKREIRISRLGTLARDVSLTDILPIVADGKTQEVSVKELLRSTFKIDDTALSSATGWSSEKINSLLGGGLEEAPIDGTQYARQDAGWSNIVAGDTSSGLEVIDEGFGIGYRIIGRDPLNYGPIGLGSVDFSESTVSSIVNGTTGSYSIGLGTDNIISGGYSYVNGDSNDVSEDGNIVTGGSNIVSGANCYVSGSSNEISGGNGIVKGSSNTVNNDACILIGDTNTSTHSFNILLGTQLNSSVKYSAWFGKYNTNTSTIALGIGNGTTDIARSNLIEVHTNGTVIVPGLDIANITDAKTLVTKEYVAANSATLPLDLEMSVTSATSYTYNEDGTLNVMTYSTSNKSIYTYVEAKLSTVQYTDTDGITVLLTITYSYDINGKLISSIRS